MKKKKCAILIWLPTHAFCSSSLPNIKAKNKDLHKIRKSPDLESSLDLQFCTIKF